MGSSEGVLGSPSVQAKGGRNLFNPLFQYLLTGSFAGGITRRRNDYLHDRRLRSNIEQGMAEPIKPSTERGERCEIWCCVRTSSGPSHHMIATDGGRNAKQAFGLYTYIVLLCFHQNRFIPTADQGRRLIAAFVHDLCEGLT